MSDKYVAVAGVPYARTDHAIAMARFARNCVQEFGKTLHELERKFGYVHELSLLVMESNC